ncbi:16224_t:CDS:1 [Funneliformis caledonium]|uniref:16224_t:CDS:1 n=1 Tax=Funneliformis caledonium TaxID=1117310 RepID=A0A9N9ERW6_9GLOM|nr:16224_t:CDS:1 [Funneliformis caledonium]
MVYYDGLTSAGTVFPRKFSPLSCQFLRDVTLYLWVMKERYTSKRASNAAGHSGLYNTKLYSPLNRYTSPVSKNFPSKLTIRSMYVDFRNIVERFCGKLFCSRSQVCRNDFLSMKFTMSISTEAF